MERPTGRESEEEKNISPTITQAMRCTTTKKKENSLPHVLLTPLNDSG
jgi:hypothetical protein